MKANEKFAKVLMTLSVEGQRVEDLAGSLLKMTAGATTLEAFDEMVREAYGINGWNTRSGRPSTADTRAKVPHTVRTYVWEMRSALKAGLTLSKFSSFGELRRARGKLRLQAAESAVPSTPLPKLPELKGVSLGNGDAPNGSLFHDLILLFTVIPEDQRALLARNLARLMARYQVVPPAPTKKRATG